MTVHQLLSSLDSRELTEWMAYFDMQPKPTKEATTDQKIEFGMKNIARMK